MLCSDHGGWCRLISGEERMLHCLQRRHGSKEEDCFKAGLHQGTEVCYRQPTPLRDTVEWSTLGKTTRAWKCLQMAWWRDG